MSGEYVACQEHNDQQHTYCMVHRCCVGQLAYTCYDPGYLRPLADYLHESCDDHSKLTGRKCTRGYGRPCVCSCGLCGPGYDVNHTCWKPACSAHHEYYQSQAKTLIDQLEPIIGIANVLPVVRIIMEEVY